MAKTTYDIDMTPRFSPLERMDLGEVAAAVTEKWWNNTLTGVNDCVVRLGVLEGEYHWHHHDEEDEFFLVLSGRLLIDLEGQTVELGPHQGVTVPRGVEHRPRAPERTVVLMVEGSGIVPTGD